MFCKEVFFKCLRHFVENSVKNLYNGVRNVKCENREACILVVPTPLVGEGITYSNGFFCPDNFGQLIYSS